MRRRAFISLFPFLSALAWRPARAANPRRIELQRSPLAGFQFYEGERIWSQMAAGDPLHLVREPMNPHDERAVAIFWHRFKLGYVPRNENSAIAQMLDRGERLGAAVTRLQKARNPWDRIEFVVWCEVE